MSIFLSILTAVIAISSLTGTVASLVFTFFFPPSFYIFAPRAIDGSERNNFVPNAIHKDPTYNLPLMEQGGFESHLRQLKTRRLLNFSARPPRLCRLRRLPSCGAYPPSSPRLLPSTTRYLLFDNSARCKSCEDTLGFGHAPLKEHCALSPVRSAQ
ncbi:hypothetical protein B0H11DRAFT_2367685 [Mycena galericulata]|nr:hypothetical protein B0H11DRAFT_2389635 [Mycena galericulata]KAJ7435343.1 hypothetical protein B0H11DRAFT_2367685 [Mycena galericulata]